MVSSFLTSIKFLPNIDLYCFTFFCAQKNVKQYKSIFGRNFIEVRNDDTKQDFEAKADKLFGRLQAWSTSFPSNKVAIKWKTAQLDAKKR